MAAAINLLLVGSLSETVLAQQTPSDEPVRLRITWGGGEASHWFGRLQLDDGPLSNLKLLGLTADGAASFWIENGAVQIATPSPRKFDGIEVTATVRAESTLRIELSPEAGRPQTPTQVPVANVVARPYVLRLDDRGNTLRIEAVPPEALRVAIERDPPIFAPGEQVSFELQAALSDLVPGTTLDIHTTLSPARRNETLWSEPQRMPVPVNGPPRTTVNVPLPRAEGVYTVRVTAMRPSGFRDRFFPGAQAPLAEQSFDVVVIRGGKPPANAVTVDSAPVGGGNDDRWEVVLEIDPANPRWWERLPAWTQLRRIPGLNRGPLGSLRAGTVDLPLGRFVELPPTPLAGDAHWQAYSLPLEGVGLPHLLEVEYPASEEQHLGISIVEPNAAGVVEGIGRDGGVYVEGFGRREHGGRLTQRLLFWPRSQAPLLLVTNQHPAASARFGTIRVLKSKEGHLNAGAVPPTAARLVAAYLARPSLPESFGATRRVYAAGADSGLPAAVHDWQTFYESATRLAQYVHYGGYNSAVVSVLADGSSIYPSKSLLPTPLHNTARATAEPREPDALELLLQVFDGEGLLLVPALQFAAPLPEVEALRRGRDPQTSGLEWIGADGRTWLATHGSREGLAPYYNLLDPSVQQAMLDVVGELLSSYSHHPSLSGVAIQLSANGYAQLPTLDWGLDDVTVGRFERDTGIRLPAAGAQRFAARHAQLTGEHVEAWRSWRAARVAEFYARLAALVRESGNQRRLLVSLEEAFEDPHLAARVRPNLLAENSVETTLLDLGIERTALEKVPGLVLCPARTVGTRVPLADKAAEFELNQAAAAWSRKRDDAATPASLLYQRPQRRRITSFEERSPFKPSGSMTLVLQPSAHQSSVCKPYVQALLEDDPEVVLDGGEILPLGQSQALRHVRSILRQLPAGAEVSEQSFQPVVVRSYSGHGEAILLIINASPWRTEAQVELETSRDTPLEPLKSDSGDLLSTITARPLMGGRQSLSVSLEPYAIEALRVAAPVKLTEVKAQISDSGMEELTAALTDLANRDLTAPRLNQGLANPGFEPVAGASSVPGWRVIGNGAVAVLDATVPQQGKTCLYLEAPSGAVAVESNSIPVPATGQIAMTLFARGQQLDPRTELRAIVEAESAGTLFRHSFIVGGAASGQPLKGEWQSYAVVVNNLPLGTAGQMRVRFELMGAGEVWLDNVTLHDLLFPLSWYNKTNGRAEVVQFIKLIHAARDAFEAGRISDCVRLLEGYWPRFLIAYTAVTQPAIAAEPPKKAEPPSAPADKAQEAPPSVGERLKRFVPFLR